MRRRLPLLGARRPPEESDPTRRSGSVFPRNHIGAQLINKPGSLVWNELATSDLARAKAFYTEAFGWGWGGDAEYAEAQVGGRTIAGVMPRGEQVPADVPDNWLVYFGTAAVDEDAAKARGLGATVVVEPTDIPGTGRFSVLIDPQGAAFGLFQPAT